jgi:hypothetical protein
MTFYEFIKNKAASYGHQCSQCGENDGYFAINGKCNICQAPMLRYGKELTLLFSLEVFIEFVDHYCKPGSIFEKGETRELLERTISGLKENIPKLNTDNLAEIQTIFKSGHEIEEIHGLYTMILNEKQTETNFTFDPNTTVYDSKGFSGALLAIQFIIVVKFSTNSSCGSGFGQGSA